VRSCLYACEVRHARARPVPHRFRYAITAFALDLDELPELDRRLRLFAWNRRGAASFHDADHLDGTAGSTKTKLERFLAARGLATGGGRIVTVTQCRLLGYVFNPVSFHWCHDPAGELVAIVAEVNSTFGERHLYVLGEAERVPGRELRYRSRKAMHVSPFLEMDGAYEFRFGELGERLAIAIDEEERGEPRLATAMTGVRRPLDDAALLRLAVLFPLQTLKITAAIHWQALRLWRKRVPIVAKPRPTPEQEAQVRALRAAAEEVRP
jgi:DUF1365 family protein